MEDAASPEPSIGKVDGKPRGGFRCTRRQLLGAGVLAAAGAATYGMWDAGRLETNEIELPEAALPGMEGTRMLHFSDLHNSWSLMAEVLRRARLLRPDIIAFTGDLITDFERLTRTRTIILQLRALAEVAPVYACLGNHDMNKRDQVERIFRASGVCLLRNETTEWRSADGRTLRIAGLGDWTEGDEDPARCLPSLEERRAGGAPILLLSHNPDSRGAVKDYGWDTMLCGHTHGGQIGNPFTGRSILSSSKMSAGLYGYADRHVFVTKGVGNIGGMRFFCEPEINLIRVGTKARP